MKYLKRKIKEMDVFTKGFLLGSSFLIVGGYFQGSGVKPIYITLYVIAGLIYLGAILRSLAREDTNN